jgi:D-amino-acid dehydrogenase
MHEVESIAAAQTQLMSTVFADYDKILKATDSSHLKLSRGAIHFYDTEKEYQQAQWQAVLRKRLGFEEHRLSPADVKSMVPCLKLGKGVATFMPDWQHLADPAKVAARIATYCITHGAKWIQDRVTRVSADDSAVSLVTETGRRINADQLVVAAGAWSNRIAQMLDRKVPMIAKRGYSSTISNPGVELDYPIMSLSRLFVMTPLQTGLRVAGTAEFASLDAEPDYRRAKTLLKHASHYLDGLNTQDASEWMGPRPMMSDSKPVISVSPRHANVFYAFGHGHYGVTQGPTTGRIIAELVTGRKVSTDLRAFRFERFF